MEKTYVERVHEVTKQIPYGRISTYGTIADYLALGSARMVGWALNKSFLVEQGIPAHRVVNRKGILTGAKHFPTPTMMQELLEQEGVKIEQSQVVEFEQHFWNPSVELE
jgi:methylated-DNA-protein-cysteine methyltransferase-like protein